MSSTEYFEELLATLLDSSKPLKASQLSELSDPSSAQAKVFEAAWPQSKTERRREIVATLGRLARENIEMLFDRLNHIILSDADPEVRRQAIANLWEAEDEATGETFAMIARDDPDEKVRREAARALGRFVYLGEVRKISADTHRSVEDTLLILLEGSPSPAIRRRALESLGYSSRDEVASHIRESYESGEEERVRSGLIAMGRSADRKWIAEVLDYLDHPAPRLRAEAARAAGELEARSSTARLIELLDDGHEDVRSAAIWALGQLGGDRARDALLALLESPEATGHEDDIEAALDHIAFLEGTPDLLTFGLEEDPETPF